MNAETNRASAIVALIGAMAVFLLVLWAPADQALAHTTVKNVNASSKVLGITFNGQIRRGAIRATNSRGRVISRGRGSRDPRNVNRLVVALKNVRSGTYRARWSMVGIDGHRQTGNVVFRVR